MAEKIETEAPQKATISGNLTSLTVEELYDKEKYDLSTMEPGDIFQLLQSSTEGLTSDEAARRIEKFGPNKLETKEINPILQFLGFMWNPLSWVMEAAAIVAIALSNGGGQPPDYPDFIGIVLLLLANATIGFLEERQAGNAVKALMAALAPECKVKRNGEWKTLEAAELVPGDIISMKLGDVVPADGRLIAAHGQVTIDQAALTGESLPVTKEAGDEVFSGSTVKQGEAEAIVIGTGTNTFFGRAAKLVGEAGDDVGHLQTILAKIGNFCLCTITLFVVIEILVMYPKFRYAYRTGIDNILVLLIGGIPIAMPTVLSVTLAIGAKQLAEHKAIVTRITAIEEMAAVTILCSDKTGTLTLNKLIVDKPTIKTYADLNGDDIILLSAYASRTENQDAIDFCIVNSLSDPKLARDGIEELEFKPFNPVVKRTEITYKENATGKVLRVTKGMSHTILDLCTRDKTEEQIKALNDDVDEFARRGLRALAVAIDEVPSGDVEGEGLGFRLIGLLPIYDPPRSDTKETIDRAIALGVSVKMITGDQLAIGKETGRRLGMGDNMFLSKTLKEGPPAGSGYSSVDEMVLNCDGFAGVYPEHKYEIVERLQAMGHMTAMTGDGVNDAPALSKANVGIAVADATDAARSAADIVLTEPGLSVIIEAIIGSRQIFQRMRNYSIYTCSVTIRVVVGFAILCFAFQFNFPPFMVLILAILNDGTIMTISTDRVKPSPYPDAWNLKEIFSYAIVYGLYLTVSTVAFFAVIYQTTFFETHFSLPHIHMPDGSEGKDVNAGIYHSVIYLQVSTISQALIFITRSRGFFFMERPSIMLMCAFVVAQLVATFIAVYADWGFTSIEGCGWNWAGIVWIWNIVWFLPLDFVKFAMRYFFEPKNNLLNSKAPNAGTSRRASAMSGTSSARYYANRTRSLKSLERPQNFAQKLMGNSGKTIDAKEMRRLSSVQTSNAAKVLNN
jgi:H+-transporting ATPase